MSQDVSIVNSTALLGQKQIVQPSCGIIAVATAFIAPKALTAGCTVLLLSHVTKTLFLYQSFPITWRQTPAEKRKYREFTNTLQWLFVRKLCLPSIIFYIYILMLTIYFMFMQLCMHLFWHWFMLLFVLLFWHLFMLLCIFLFYLCIYAFSFYLLVLLFICNFLHGKYFFMPLEIYLGQKISIMVFRNFLD